MELGLRLGDASEPMKFLQENSAQDQARRSFTKIKRSSTGGLNLGMDLRLNQEMEKSSRGFDEENGKKEDHDHSSDQGVLGSDGDHQGEASLQLNLLPFSPVPRQIESLPWSSDNGSSENDSSRNKGVTATRRLDVNRLPAAAAAAAEEVSTANSEEGSLFQMDFGNKRSEFEATGNERESFRASDDDDGSNTRKKLRLSKQQSVFLEQSFKEHPTLNPKQKLALANQLNLRPRQVEVWFQNRRARTKLKQNEVDCEYLKRCCETLSEENARLHKELQDLRALKTPNSNPFYMATTLTMCPSCERQRLASAPEIINNGANLPNIDSTPTPNPTPFPLSTTPRFYPWRST
ncbi:homeobox-leucine zipper protein HAT4-like [Henckelia pumila]|uniref:homeobox-leucine zipper protein HAT4-like n=1 Tax=Henckelia pumila TaxID=405737 RepID=UPI003C6E4C61